MRFDVVIVGRGMVGLALARMWVDESIRPANFRLAMIDSGPSQDSLQADLRVSALNLAAIEQFRGWGLWTDQYFPDPAYYRHMEVWDAASSGKMIFHASELSQLFLGAIVKNADVVEALRQDLMRQPWVTFFSGTECRAIDQEEKGEWRLSLSNGTEISAQILVGADGGASPIREQLGIEVDRSDYGQQAIVARIHSENPHEFTAYQRFLKEGPVAFLPLADLHQGSLVWTVSKEESQRLLSLSEAEFSAELTIALDHRLGAMTLGSTRLHFPLKTHHAKTYTKPGAFLIGDAAHGVHPLAGQGVNLGFHDVRVLEKVLREATAQNRPLLTFANFKRYERQAFFYNESIRQSMTFINRLFLNQKSGDICSKIRGSGMDFIHRFGIVKNLFSEVAQG